MSISPEIVNEVISLSGSPPDAEWYWLLVGGPHGYSFTWGHCRVESLGYVGREHLEKRLKEEVSSDPDFIEKLQKVVRLALTSTHHTLLVRAIQLAGVIGEEEELKVVSELRHHRNSWVSKHAKACTFHLKRKR